MTNFVYNTLRRNADQTTSAITAPQIINMLCHSNDLHRAHIGEIWTICNSGITYSGQDGDTLSAALSASRQPAREPRDYESGWAARWAKEPDAIEASIKWARSIELAA